MVRSILMAVVVLAAAPAFATGERVILAGASAPFADQLKETLCVSMECIDKAQASANGFDVTVTARAVKSQVEVKVVGADGVLRLTQKVKVNDDGRIASTDLVSATSAILASIEAPAPAPKAEAKKHASKSKTKKPSMHLVAKARVSRARG